MRTEKKPKPIVTYQRLSQSSRNKTSRHSTNASVELAPTLLSFLKAAVALGIIHISEEAFNNVQYIDHNPDGSAKFSKSGRPVIKLNDDIAKNIKLIEHNLNKLVKYHLMDNDACFDTNEFIQSLTIEINQSLAANGINPELKQKINCLFSSGLFGTDIHCLDESTRKFILSRAEAKRSLDELKYDWSNCLLPGNEGKNREIALRMLRRGQNPDVAFELTPEALIELERRLSNAELKEKQEEKHTMLSQDNLVSFLLSRPSQRKTWHYPIQYDDLAKDPARVMKLKIEKLKKECKDLEDQVRKDKPEVRSVSYVNDEGQLNVEVETYKPDPGPKVSLSQKQEELARLIGEWEKQKNSGKSKLDL